MALKIGRPLRKAGMVEDLHEAMAVLSHGPVQVLVYGFADPHLHGRIHAALDHLRGNGTIRVIDRALVGHGADGELTCVRSTDTDGKEMGAIVDALLAGGESDWIEEEVARFDTTLPKGQWLLKEKCPKGTAVFVVIIEHLWARELRNALIDEGGFHLADEWLHPVDLAAIGYFGTSEDAPESGTQSHSRHS